MPAFREANVNAEQLLLDPNNYRYQDEEDFSMADPKRFHESTVQDRAFKRLKEEGLLDLKNSILKNGFLPVERIVVRENEHSPETFVVIEGNRRVAALKWIKEDYEAGVPVPDQVMDTVGGIPVLIVDASSDDPAFFEALMGIRHVSGIKQWGGYQRAKLVGVLKDDRGLESGDVAERLGMSTHEVNRRYRAFKALEQMQQDDAFGVHARPSMYPLFHEAVSLPVVRDWLGWDESTGQFTDQAKIEEFYKLITPGVDEDGNESEPKLPTYQEVRALKDILPNEEAKRVLLDEAKPFLEALTIAKREELSREWKSEVASVISALQNIGIIEFSHLNTEDVAEIEKLKRIAEELLDKYQRLNA